MPAAPSPAPDELRFCVSLDGTRIARAKHGAGPPLVIAGLWIGGVEHGRRSPLWQHLLDELGSMATVHRFDEAGCGLSDWDIGDVSLDARLTHLEAVVDDAGIDRFALLGLSHGGSVAMAYAARHPERVSRLVLFGAYSVGVSDDTDDLVSAVIRVGWQRPTPEFRRVLTAGLLPDAEEGPRRYLDDAMASTTSAENAARLLAAYRDVDVTALLACVGAPTLVLHSRHDRLVPFDAAVRVAAGIRGARLVGLETANHIVLGDDPAWQVVRRELTSFLTTDRTDHIDEPTTPRSSTLEALSDREVEVLRLAATGQGNEAIAASLFISVRTVERHLQNSYVKLGVQGKSARAAAVGALYRSR